MSIYKAIVADLDDQKNQFSGSALNDYIRGLNIEYSRKKKHHPKFNPAPDQERMFMIEKQESSLSLPPENTNEVSDKLENNNNNNNPDMSSLSPQVETKPVSQNNQDQKIDHEKLILDLSSDISLIPINRQNPVKSLQSHSNSISFSAMNMNRSNVYQYSQNNPRQPINYSNNNNYANYNRTINSKINPISFQKTSRSIQEKFPLFFYQNQQLMNANWPVLWDTSNIHKFPLKLERSDDALEFADTSSKAQP